MRNLFGNVDKYLEEGLHALKCMRGSKTDGFQYMVLEDCYTIAKENYENEIKKNFDVDLMNEVNQQCEIKGYKFFSEDYINVLKQQYQEKRFHQTRTFWDMDGVLYVFDQSVESLDCLYEQGYFENIALNKIVAYALNEQLKVEPWNTYIISHYLDSSYARAEKLNSLHKNFPDLIESNLILVPYGERKDSYVPGGIKKNDILIDDYNSNLKYWREAGGTSVKMVNGINDRNHSWEGLRLYFDDPGLTESISRILESSELVDSLDKMNTFQKEIVSYDLER